MLLLLLLLLLLWEQCESCWVFITKINKNIKNASVTDVIVVFLPPRGLLVVNTVKLLVEYSSRLTIIYLIYLPYFIFIVIILSN